MADFADLDTFFDASLPLPIGGKTYKVPSPPGETGLKIQRWSEALVKDVKDRDDSDRQVMTDAQEMDFYAEVLGSAYAEMRADGVQWEKIKHSALTAMRWIVNGEDSAVRYWASPGKPKPGRKTRKSSTDEANETPQPDSSNGTNTRPAGTSD